MYLCAIPIGGDFVAYVITAVLHNPSIVLVNSEHPLKRDNQKENLRYVVKIQIRSIVADGSVLTFYGRRYVLLSGKQNIQLMGDPPPTESVSRVSSKSRWKRMADLDVVYVCD